MSASRITHQTIERSSSANHLFREEFARGSQLSRAPQGRNALSYDTARYPFAKHVARLLVDKELTDETTLANLGSLGRLHEVLDREFTSLDDGELNAASRMFYDTDAAFVETYEAFLKNVVRDKVVGDDFLFQTTPTIRFHFPNEEGFDWNPRMHTDIMLGHPPQEINIWLPVCGASGTASMCIADMVPSIEMIEEFDYDFAQFATAVQESDTVAARCASMSKPVELEYGEFLVFDPRCLHATQFNQSDVTRISFDFRVLPLEDYERIQFPYRGTGRRRLEFKRGSYYDERDSRSL